MILLPSKIVVKKNILMYIPVIIYQGGICNTPSYKKTIYSITQINLKVKLFSTYLAKLTE